jgi:membrane protein implicated in regulation of membrane protease activity
VPDWVIWAIVAVGLAIGEILTPGMFFLGPVALAALVAGLAALAGVGVVAQVLVFVVCSFASLAFLRPIARRHIHLPEISRTGTDALVGKKALVLKTVDANGGLVRIGGEEWTARAYMDDGVYEPGARVEVVKIEGATALVFE